MQGQGLSSLSIWTAFNNVTTAFMRVIKYVLNISWNRVQDDTTGYAIIGTSLIAGLDLVKGQSSVVSLPDLFTYQNETANAMQIEYDRALVEPLGGIAMALLDVVLDNSDNRFTPNQNATIGTAILPNRPINSHVGFLVQSETKTLPIFKGLTKQPRMNKMNKTATIACIDYVRFLTEFPLESAIYTDQRSDQIIQSVLADVGFGSSQYVLGTGLNTIEFAWFDKGDTAGERIKKICEAEEAVFYQDELGILRFENRRAFTQAPHNASVWDIRKDDIMLWEEDESTQVINKCFVVSKPRAVQANTELWRDGVEEVLLPGEVITIWARFDNPATDITAISATTDYTAFTATGGGGSNITSDIGIVVTEFTTTAKLVITNSSSSSAYVNFLRLRGTPATVTGEIIQQAQDDTSISKYGENQVEIKNDFIDDASFARYLAGAVVNKYSEPTRRIVLTVQGIPQLQLRDKVMVEDMDLGTLKAYRVMRIQGTLSAGSFKQKLYLREVTNAEADAWALVGTATVENESEFVGT